MNKVFSTNFNFLTIVFEKYHHTDNRSGSPQHYIAYMEQGNARIVSDHITIEIKAGDVFYIPKGLSYQSYWYSEKEIRFKSFGFDLFLESKKEDYILQKIEHNNEVVQQISNIATNTPVNSGILGDFYSALTTILPKMKHYELNSKKMIIEKAKSYIYNHSDCKIPDIAKHCLISESALYELFKNEAGITPNGMRQKILCEKAEILLTTTDKSVQEIADILGFSSTSYFRKQLLKHVGKTPREIRKDARRI